MRSVRTLVDDFFFCDALQIRFNPGGNAAIVADVLSGVTDVGFARTDTIYSFKPGLRLLMPSATPSAPSSCY